jgi:hypothetical protein
MFEASCRALTALLDRLFPDVGTIYINNEPAEPVKPSFTLRLAGGTEERAASRKYQSKAVWQIVYVPVQRADGSADAINQLLALDTLKEAIMDAAVLQGEDGSVFAVTGVELGLSDKNVVWMNVTVQAERVQIGPQDQMMSKLNMRTEG